MPSKTNTSDKYPYLRVPAYRMEFPEGDSDKFFVGAEDFMLYQCNMHHESKKYVK